MKKKKKIQVQGRDDEPTKKERNRSRNETLQKEIPKSKLKFEAKPYKKKSLKVRSSKRSPKAEVKALQKKFPRSKLEVEEPKKRKTKR